MCPGCYGSGRIRKRFLLFFTRRAPCPKCHGTGEFPPPVTKPARVSVPIRDDDRDTWTTRSSYDRSDSESRLGRDSFQVGSGGRSGGGGGGASWGDAGDNAPVIVDPFASDSSYSASSAIAADTVEADSGSSSDDAGSRGGSSASTDGGTSY